MKKVHKIDKYWNEDNMDQELEKLEERKEETAVSEEKPLKIEDFIVKKGKLRFSRKSMPYNYRKRTFNYKE